MRNIKLRNIKLRNTDKAGAKMSRFVFKFQMKRQQQNGPSKRKRAKKANKVIFDKDGTVALSPRSSLVITSSVLPAKTADKLLQVFQSMPRLDLTDAMRERQRDGTLDTSLFQGKFTRPDVRIFGKYIPIPRDQIAFGEGSYKFSGLSVEARPWSEVPELLEARDLISKHVGVPFHFALVNRYVTGNDNIGWHSDDEKDLVDGAPIASLTLGADREFYLRHKPPAADKATFCVPTRHNLLVVMGGKCQQEFQHSVPKRAKITGVRINITFRSKAAQQAIEVPVVQSRAGLQH
jgi:alkylated DNA repair dioxygenase AlkB